MVGELHAAREFPLACLRGSRPNLLDTPRPTPGVFRPDQQPHQRPRPPAAADNPPIPPGAAVVSVSPPPLGATHIHAGKEPGPPPAPGENGHRARDNHHGISTSCSLAIWAGYGVHWGCARTSGGRLD